MISNQFRKSVSAIVFASNLVIPSSADQTTTKNPWLVKPEEELTKAAMRQDSSYLWIGGKYYRSVMPAV